MKKKLFFVLVSMMCFLVFPIGGKALEGYEDIKYNKDARSADDPCIKNHTCIKVCEWGHSQVSDPTNPYHIYAYYMLDDSSWKYVWFSPVGTSPRSATSSNSLVPNDKNIFYQNGDLKSNMSFNGTCPAGAYVDMSGNDGFVDFIFGAGGGVIGDKLNGGNSNTRQYDLCFDDKIPDSEEKTACHKKNNFGTKFEGDSSLIYKATDMIDNYFEKKQKAGVDCSSIATDYVVDVTKAQTILLDKFASDFTKTVLYSKKMPSWMNSSFETNMSKYKSNVKLWVRSCNVSQKMKASVALQSGKITQEKYDELDGKAAKVEAEIASRLESLENNIKKGLSPSDPDYKPDDPNISVDVDASCKTLLGEKTLGYLKTALTVIQIGGVVLAIVLGMSDFLGAVISGENDANKKAGKRLLTRVILAGTLFLIPVILKFVLSSIGIKDDTICVVK